MRELTNPLKLWLVALLAILSILAMSACGSSGTASPDENVSQPRDPRCLNVPRSVVRAIATGLKVTGGGTLRFAQAVKSGDFSRVYFVSADLQGSGLEGTDDVGTWAINRLRLGGLILTVDSVSEEFSDWGHGDTTDAQLSMSDDGAELSQECVAAIAK